jgi:hypothetical protein
VEKADVRFPMSGPMLPSSHQFWYPISCSFNSKHLYCIPVFIAATACFLSFYSTPCKFVQFVSGAEGPVDPISLHLGYWSYQNFTINNSTNSTEIEEICVLYPVDQIATDTTFKVGRTFNLLALILGVSFIFLDILTGCSSINPRKSFRQGGGVGYLLCSLCSGLSLLILQVSCC